MSEGERQGNGREKEGTREASKRKKLERKRPEVSERKERRSRKEREGREARRNYSHPYNDKWRKGGTSITNNSSDCKSSWDAFEKESLFVFKSFSSSEVPRRRRMPMKESAGSCFTAMKLREMKPRISRHERICNFCKSKYFLSGPILPVVPQHKSKTRNSSLGPIHRRVRTRSIYMYILAFIGAPAEVPRFVFSLCPSCVKAGNGFL